MPSAPLASFFMIIKSILILALKGVQNPTPLADYKTFRGKYRIITTDFFATIMRWKNDRLMHFLKWFLFVGLLTLCL
jgi:hypothetical protein